MLLLVSPLLHATPSITNNNVVEFSLLLSRHDTQFNFSGNNNKIKTETAGIKWYEPFTPYFQAGLEVGYIQLTQTLPKISSQHTKGEYAGLLFRFLPIKKKSLSLNLNMNYRYNRSKGKTLNQETKYFWHEVLFSSEIMFQATEKAGLSLAAEYLFTDGEKQTNSSTNQIETFNINKQRGIRYGLHFKPSRTEIIGLEWLSGYKNGVQIYFGRKF